MAADLYNEKFIARYLLGDLPEEHQVEIEDRAFRDKEYLASVTAVENDLIDEYVRHELSEADRQRFEERFLASASRRKRVEFAKALSLVAVSEQPVAEKTAVTRTTPAAPSWYESLVAFIRGLAPAAQFAFAAAILLLLIGGGWLVVETMRVRGELTRMQAQNQSQQNDRQTLQQQAEIERKRNEELAARLIQEQQQRQQTGESASQSSGKQEATNPPPKPIVASLTLLPGLSRGANDKPKLVLPPDARVVSLKIGIEPTEQYKNFALELSTVGGRHVWSREKLSARAVRGGRVVALTLPATALKVGEYELRLKGLTETGTTEDVGFYYFEVTKK